MRTAQGKVKAQSDESKAERVCRGMCKMNRELNRDEGSDGGSDGGMGRRRDVVERLKRHVEKQGQLEDQDTLSPCHTPRAQLPITQPQHREEGGADYTLVPRDTCVCMCVCLC